ncbi:hypothetical protein GCL60_09925 [Silvanigrella paludirubra]|uniref:Uncharacterized protein n=1 Tax=Silvanigrella paludirubra TaxID=2499159 RepID=A0A6N6VVC2_9BACT|nr:hypothetical protein [Silvanigrella paludirubra]KAB8039164.1 hypothetical protein GCL60_09925 [Silvanigrella paludirubra]
MSDIMYENELKTYEHLNKEAQILITKMSYDEKKETFDRLDFENWFGNPFDEDIEKCALYNSLKDFFGGSPICNRMDSEVLIRKLSYSEGQTETEKRCNYECIYN